MPSLNKIILIGRFTQEPEVRYTASNLIVASFTIAVDRPYGRGEGGEKKTDFFRCKAWRQKAEFVKDYVGKGRLVCVEGRVELNDFVGQDGQKRYVTEVVVDQIETLDSARDRVGDAAPADEGERERPAPARTARPARQNDDDGGYFADDDPAPARPARAPRADSGREAPARDGARSEAREGGRSESGRSESGRGESGRGEGRSAAPARPARPAPAAYPEEDFDDSDPFADE